MVRRREGADRVELFQLSVDPSERNDLSTEQPARVAKMLEALAAQESRDDDALPLDSK